jgi:hypothetical protein
MVMTEDVAPREASYPSIRFIVAGLVIAPLAWLVQTLVAETLAAQSCYPSSQPLSAPSIPWMRTALTVLSAVCLLAGIAGSAIAWRNVRRIGAAQRGESTGERRTQAGLAWFVSHVAAMCSALFLFALVATDIALAIVSPCRWW